MNKLGIGAMVRVHLIIGTNGAIEKCLVDVVKRGEFEEAVCANIAHRAKFAPALDADGKPSRSYWEGTWRFAS